MTPKFLMKWTLAAGLAAFAASGLVLEAQSAPAAALGSVRIPRPVLADGKPLPAGTYSIRLSSEAVTPVVGQPAGGERWVEFLQGGAVKGRELATVEDTTEVKGVAKITPPASGAAKIQLLKGADYLRVWINHAGTHYLVHLPTAGPVSASAPAK